MDLTYPTNGFEMKLQKCFAFVCVGPPDNSARQIYKHDDFTEAIWSFW